MVARFVAALVCFALSACAAPGRAPAVFSPWYPPTSANGDPVFAVYEGRIPCHEAALAGCQTIKVALVLYRQSASATPITYQLARVYVAAGPEGRQVVAGAATVARGTPLDANARVYVLDTNSPREFRRYWAIGDDLLLLLDESGGPKVGTASWSYTLSRTR